MTDAPPPRHQPAQPAHPTPATTALTHAQAFALAPEIVLDGPQAVVRAFFDGREPTTRAAYERDLVVFAEFLATAGVGRHPGKGFDAEIVTHAVAWLFSQTQGKANQVVLAYRNWLGRKGLSAATVNRRLAAVKSMGKIARLLGHVHWTVEVPGLKENKVRDTRGPGSDGVQALMEVLARRYASAVALGRAHPERAEEARVYLAWVVRDRAILRLLFDLALRRNEVAGLALADVSFTGRKLRVRRKGGKIRFLTLPAATLKALAAWIKVRGTKPGALFLPLHGAATLAEALERRSAAISAVSIYRMIRKLGKDAGLKVWPHALRHAAITEALDATGGDVRAVARFSGHKQVSTVMVYDDQRKDPQGEIAGKVADSLSRKIE